jgi:hypothetical protein
LFGRQFLGAERCREEAESQKETVGHGGRMMARGRGGYKKDQAKE